jgi:hypothetical protein
VEILSTLEEKMPDLPTVSPEVLGSLKTLGQIVDYLVATDNSDGGAIQSEQAESAAGQGLANHMPPASTDQLKDLKATMLAVVSQLTGYPIEMLGMDMDIQAGGNFIHPRRKNARFAHRLPRSPGQLKNPGANC